MVMIGSHNDILELYIQHTYYLFIYYYILSKFFIFKDDMFMYDVAIGEV